MARLILLLPILLLEFLIAVPVHVYSYCIYNEMNDGLQLNVKQTYDQAEALKNNSW